MPERVVRKTVPIQVPLPPKLAQIVGSTRKDLVPIASAWDFAFEEWRKRFQLQMEQALGMVVTFTENNAVGTGTAGAKGDKGDKGDTGARGPTGAAGADGADGFQYPIDGGVAASVYASVPPMDSGTASATFGGVLLDAGGAS